MNEPTPLNPTWTPEVPLPRAPLARVIAQVRFPPILAIRDPDKVAVGRPVARGSPYPSLPRRSGRPSAESASASSGGRTGTARCSGQGSRRPCQADAEDDGLILHAFVGRGRPTDRPSSPGVASGRCLSGRRPGVSAFCRSVPSAQPCFYAGGRDPRARTRGHRGWTHARAGRSAWRGDAQSDVRCRSRLSGPPICRDRALDRGARTMGRRDPPPQATRLRVCPQHRWRAPRRRP